MNSVGQYYTVANSENTMRFAKYYRWWHDCNGVLRTDPDLSIHKQQTSQVISKGIIFCKTANQYIMKYIFNGYNNPKW